MTITSYRDLVAWQKSIGFVAAVYRATAAWRADERYGLVRQLRRAAVSVPANIAEGHGRATAGEFLNSLSVARRSLNEVRTLVAIGRELGIATPAQLHALDEYADEIARILWSLRQSLLSGRGERGTGHGAQNTD